MGGGEELEKKKKKGKKRKSCPAATAGAARSITYRRARAGCEPLPLPPSPPPPPEAGCGRERAQSLPLEPPGVTGREGRAGAAAWASPCGAAAAAVPGRGGAARGRPPAPGMEDVGEREGRSPQQGWVRREARNPPREGGGNEPPFAVKGENRGSTPTVTWFQRQGFTRGSSRVNVWNG